MNTRPTSICARVTHQASGTTPFRRWMEARVLIPGICLFLGAVAVAGGETLDSAATMQAGMSAPWSVAVDGAGNRYVAVMSEHRIVHIDPHGRLSVVAGTGTEGYSGDGGPATEASLDSPTGVALDAAGNLYIADRYNDRIRKVDATTGIITTYAGGGDPDDGLGDKGAATAASLASPVDVAVDCAGNVVIADEFNNRVRKVDATTGRIDTVAGGGEPADELGDGGPATAARLSAPTGIALDGDGNLYIADRGHQRVRKVDTTGKIITLAGNGSYGFGGDGGPALQAQLAIPFDVALDWQGNLYIADFGNNRVRRVDAAGTITTFAGNGSTGYSGDGGPAKDARLFAPTALTFDLAGNAYIVDRDNLRVRQVSSSGIITTVLGNGTPGHSDQSREASASGVTPSGGATLEAAGRP